MGIGEFNSDDHYIYYWGQNYHRRSGVALIIKKRFQNAVIGCKLKNDKRKEKKNFSLFPRQIIQNHSNPSLWHNHWYQRNWSWSVLWRPRKPPRTKTKKRRPINHRRLECNSRKSGDDWVTGRFGFGLQNEEGQRLREFCQENILVIANTLFQQRQTWLYIWTSQSGQYLNQIDYIFCILLAKLC